MLRSSSSTETKGSSLIQTPSLRRLALHPPRKQREVGLTLIQILLTQTPCSSSSMETDGSGLNHLIQIPLTQMPRLSSSKGSGLNSLIQTPSLRCLTRHPSLSFRFPSLRRLACHPPRKQREEGLTLIQTPLT